MVLYNLWGHDVDLEIDQSVFPSKEDIQEMDSIFSESCKVTHGFIKGTTGQLLHYRKYLPPEDERVRALCVWHHGIQAHSGMGMKLPSSGRITNFALLSRHLTRAGYALYTLDMLGHGYSEGTRFYIPDWRINRDDLDAFARFAASEHPEGTPLFLGAESYGGCLAIHVGRKWQNITAAERQSVDSAPDFCCGTPIPSQDFLSSKTSSESSCLSLPVPISFLGLCLIAPAIVGDLPPKPVVFALRHFLRPVAPKWTPFFMPNPVSADQIWSDAEVRDMKMASRQKTMRLEASGVPFRLGTASELLSALESVREEAIPGLRVPFCVCHGMKDGGVPILGTEYLLEYCETKQNEKAVQRLDGVKHDLLAEPTAEQTIEFILSWMDDRIRGNIAKMTNHT